MKQSNKLSKEVQDMKEIYIVADDDWLAQELKKEGIGIGTIEQRGKKRDRFFATSGCFLIGLIVILVTTYLVTKFLAPLL